MMQTSMLLSSSNLFSLREFFCNERILICFNGPISRTLISEIGVALKDHIESTQAHQSAAMDVFSVYIEMSQNIRHYASRMDYNDRESSATVVIAEQMTAANFIESAIGNTPNQICNTIVGDLAGSPPGEKAYNSANNIADKILGGISGAQANPIAGNHADVMPDSVSTHYAVSAGNLVEPADGEALLKRIQEIARLDKTELKRLYKRQLRSPRSPDQSSGAGLGLIEMARKASQPLEAKLDAGPAGKVFFSLRAII